MAQLTDTEQLLLDKILTAKEENIVSALSAATLTQNVLVAALNDAHHLWEYGHLKKELLALVNHRLLNSTVITSVFTTAQTKVATYLVQSKYATQAMLEAVLEDTDLIDSARLAKGISSARRLVREALASNKCSYALAATFFKDPEFETMAYMNPNIPIEVLREAYTNGKHHEVTNNYHCPEDLSRLYFSQRYKEKKDIRFLIRNAYSPKLRTKNFPQDLLLKFARLEVLCAVEVVTYPNFPSNELATLFHKQEDASLLVSAILSSPNCPLFILAAAAFNPASRYTHLSKLVKNPTLNKKVLLSLVFSEHSEIRAWAKLHPNAPDYLLQL